MREDTDVILTPQLRFANQDCDYNIPALMVRTDESGTSFSKTATLIIPNLIHLISAAADEDQLSHLAVDVFSSFFASNHDWEFTIAASIGQYPLQKHVFYKWYGRHQFLIPLTWLRQDSNILTLAAQCVRSSELPNGVPHFEVSSFLISKSYMERELEARAVWLFSTARSGSTWLSSDVISTFDIFRPLDETGVGRMFAPLRWDPEYHFDDADREHYIETNWDFETGALVREPFERPFFERSFSILEQENQILNRHNFDFYHEMLKNITIEHVLNEWGLIGYERLIFKMPNDSHAADFVMRAFPNSKLIFLIRDGRDVMRSRFSQFASNVLAETTDANLRRYAILYFSHFWNFQIDIIRYAFERHDADRRFLIRYEDLRQNPIEWISKLHAFTVGLEQKDETDDTSVGLSINIHQIAESTRLENIPVEERGPDKPRQSGKVGGYIGAFSADEIALMNAVMGPNLRRYGYGVPDVDKAPAAPPTDDSPDDTPNSIQDAASEALVEIEPVLEFEPVDQPEPTTLNLPIDRMSKVSLVGAAVGFFPDGWVRPAASFRCRAFETITSMSLHVWCPPGPELLNLALEAADGRIVSLPIEPEMNSIVQFAISVSASDEFTISLRADHKSQLSETDSRHASYILRDIGFS